VTVTRPGDPSETLAQANSVFKADANVWLAPMEAAAAAARIGPVKSLAEWFAGVLKHRSVFSMNSQLHVAKGKDLIARLSFEEPESCSNQCQPAENVAVVEGRLALVA
jgi:hypothetical protein